MSTIYVLGLEGAHVPPKSVDPKQKRAKELKAKFRAARVVRLDTTAVPNDDLIGKLKGGDVVVGNMNVMTAARCEAAGAIMVCHDSEGRLFRVNAQSVEVAL